VIAKSYPHFAPKQEGCAVAEKYHPTKYGFSAGCEVKKVVCDINICVIIIV
jgi:hypothetical protein